MSEVYSQKLRSIGIISRVVNSETDLDAILENIAHAVCEHSSWSTSSIMRIDRSEGYSFLVTEHNPFRDKEQKLQDRWALSSSPTVEVLNQEAPLVIPDAQKASKYPGYKEDSILWDYHTVVILKLNCHDADGNPLVMSVHSFEVLEVDEIELSFLKTVAELTSIAIEKTLRLQKERSLMNRLQNTVEIYTDLMIQVLSAGDLTTVVNRVQSMIPKPIMLIDLTTHAILPRQSPETEKLPQQDWDRILSDDVSRWLYEKLESSQTKGPAQYILELPVDQGANRTILIQPLEVDHKTVGALAVFEEEPGGDKLDEFLLQAVRFALSVQLMRSFVRFRAVAESQADLIGSLLNNDWKNKDETISRGHNLGLILESDNRLLAIPIEKETRKSTEKDYLHKQQRLANIVKRITNNGCVARNQDKFVIIIPQQKKEKAFESLTEKLFGELKWIQQASPTIAVSRTCSTLEDYALANTELDQALRLSKALGQTGIVSVSDFGGLGLLLSSAGRDNIENFIQSTIGKIEQYDQRTNSSLMNTLSAFIDEGCRYQASADKLGVHVTTLRYRLTRLENLFDIDFSNPTSRFDLNLAMQLRQMTRPGGLNETSEKHIKKAE